MPELYRRRWLPCPARAQGGIGCGDVWCDDLKRVLLHHVGERAGVDPPPKVLLVYGDSLDAMRAMLVKSNAPCVEVVHWILPKTEDAGHGGEAIAIQTDLESHIVALKKFIIVRRDMHIIYKHAAPATVCSKHAAVPYSGLL